MRIAVIGSGIAGLGVAWQLRDIADVTIYEKNGRLGGHSHTVMVPGAMGSEIPVDTGFIVCNRKTYPNLIALFAALDIETIASDMSFAASLDDGSVEYAGDNLASLIGHWDNLFRPRHWRMLIDLKRFLDNGKDLLKDSNISLGQFLKRHNYSAAFRDDHLLPMASAIWSMPPASVLDFPARAFGEFFRNHGLLEANIASRPEWRTVKGGSREYVQRLVSESGARIVTDAKIEKIENSADNAQIYMQDGTLQDFDHVVIATHADEALALLPNASLETKDMLSAFRYSANETYLHSDETLMPKRRHLWASWNYMQKKGMNNSKLFVSYWMNRLQAIDRATPFFVTLNPPQPPAKEKTYLQQTYHHPQFDKATLSAQQKLRSIQGKDRIWFCGSYCGFGFHEDALASGLAVAAALGAPRAWQVSDVSPAFANATPLGMS